MARLMFYRYVCLPVIFTIITCISVMAQTGTITGKVTSAVNKQGLGGASVFLSNATFGTTTGDDGTFTLRTVKPGQYQLVVTNLGFETEVRTIMVSTTILNLNTIELLPKITELRPVIITTNANWKKNYALFVKEFIGTSANSKQCKVVNPRAVSLAYYTTQRQLEAYTDEFLVVENKALGYRVKYLIKEFTSNKISGITAYQGQALFEELPGSASQKKKWKVKRDEAYYGSAKHFYRALYTNRLAEDGFIVYKFTRQPNPERPDEGIIQAKLSQFKNNPDSVRYWSAKAELPKYYNENLQRTPLPAYSILLKTEKPGVFAISTNNNYQLYIIYTPKREETFFRDLYRPLDMENFETSVVTLYGQYTFFDMNGVVISQPPLYEGTWAKAKLAELLPVDYAP